MSLRLSPFPQAHGSEKYTVCLCYRSTRLDKAIRLRDGLSHLGLQVLMIAPDEYQLYPDEEALIRALQQFIGQADACVVLLKEAFDSRWVNVELSEACRVLGRIVFVYDGPWVPASGYPFQDPASPAISVGLIVKHSTIQITGWDAESLEHLATQIVNDPEEGVFDSMDDRQFISDWIARDIKLESQMRKYARRSLIVDPRCRGKTIRDVMAFPFATIPDGVAGMDLLLWYAATRGRPSLVRSVWNGELESFNTAYNAPDLDCLRGQRSSWLEVLYTCVPSGREAATVE